MKTILHIGAHRPATTSLQYYLRDCQSALQSRGVAFWGPWRTRGGMFSGIIPYSDGLHPVAQIDRARGRLAVQRAKLKKSGVHSLFISDENALGMMKDGVREAALYPAAGERMARFFAAFGGDDFEIALTIRDLDLYWASVLSFCIARGAPVPSPRRIDAIAAESRSWRHVIDDISCAMPGVPITVYPFEVFAGRPQAVLTHAVGCGAPRPLMDRWMNKTLTESDLKVLLDERGDRAARQLGTSDTRWMPFPPRAAAQLRARYAADLDWRSNGAAGRAKLARLPAPKHRLTLVRPGPAEPKTRGRPQHGIEKRHMAQPG